VLNKPLEWIVLVLTLGIYLFFRSKHLHWAERTVSSVVPAGLALGLSAEVAPWTADSELLAAIGIMVVGPMILNWLLTAGEDEDFIKRTLQDWTRKRLGLEAEDNDKTG